MKETPLGRAWSALNLIDSPISVDHRGHTDGVEYVAVGLDAMADALAVLLELDDLAGEPLDAVLAEIGSSPALRGRFELEKSNVDTIVTACGELHAMVTQVGYGGSLGEENVDLAETLRSDMYDFLNELLSSVESEDVADEEGGRS